MEFRSERLILRQATMNDASFIHELLNQDSFKDNIADKQINSLEDAKQYITTAFIEPYKSNTFAPYVVCLRDEARDFKAIGISGLYKRPNLHFPDLGYAFLDEWSGQGFASEAAQVMINYTKDSLKQGYICALTSPKNQRSISLLEKCGFKLATQIIFNKDQGISNLYQLCLLSE